MTDKFYIGIDPGINGGLCCLNQAGDIRYLSVMPTTKIGTKNAVDAREVYLWLARCMTQELVRIVAIEEQRPMHKQGVTSTFSIGKSFGILEGILAAIELPYEIIRPSIWQREMFKGYPRDNTKTLSAKVASQLFPKQEFIKSKRCTKIHDGMTDATLIAEFARRQIK